ncbi:MAG: BMP family ABC transporter substrate-binding protein [Clostridiaceae bacterium]|nr:BMP family ABC transporter substrate-binding protein [Clostridiaceae bacterium]MBW4859032.1 BMP family ABC transporter substrate-binding protein [Clostridiaceae bacterium]MBW4869607.1 BMP family ABC transporter substrate-binding protein [Clostridiaceae bacterium]
MKKILALLMIAILAFTVVGCSGGDKADDTKKPAEQKEGEENKATDEQLKITMVTDVGGVNDQSFNQSAWEGLQKADKDLGTKSDYQESHQDADFVPNLETALDAENDLIWGIGFKLANAVYSAAEENSDTKYAIVDFSYEGDEKNFPDGTPDNVVGVVFKQEQPSFLVGYIAAMMSETGKVGFVGGMESEVISAFDYGYQAGVAYANKVADKDVKVLRQYAEAFGDSAKGKAIASSMYQQGADIVFHAAGGTGDGVIEAAKEQDKYAIGVDRDQNDLAPDNVITSAMKRVDVGVYNVIKDLKEGKFPGGTTVVYGLEEGAVDIAPTSDKHVPKEILDKVEELKKLIIDGEIKVPVDEDSYEEYLKTLE